MHRHTLWGWSHTPIFILAYYQSPDTLSIHIVSWMWIALHRGYEPQPWNFVITQAQLRLRFLRSTPKIISNIHPRPSQAYQCMRVDPYAHQQHVKVKVFKHFALCMHIIWMWNTPHRGFEPQPWHTSSLRLRCTPEIPNIQPPRSALVSLYGWIHMPIHSISRCLNTLHTHMIWMWDAV